MSKMAVIHIGGGSSSESYFRLLSERTNGKIISCTNSEESVESSKLKFLFCAESENFAQQVNRALLFSDAELFLILNGTVLPEPDWEKRSALQKMDGAFIIEARVGLSKADDADSGRNGSVLIFSRQTVEKLGGFDERFQLQSSAIEEFCYRAAQENIQIVTIEEPLLSGDFGIRIDDKNAADSDVRLLQLKWPEMKEFDAPPIITSSDLSESQINAMMEEANGAIGRGDAEAALLLYKQILDSNPAQIEALINQSTVKYQFGQKDDGVEGLERAIRIDPTYHGAYLVLANIKEAEGDFESAREFYRQTISRDIGSDQAYDGYERVSKQLGLEVVEEPVDFLIYTGGFSTFDGSTIHKKSLGGSESALYYIARHIAEQGYRVKVFNNCEEPGYYEDVEYRDLVDFYIFTRWNRPKVFISSRSFKPIFNKVQADTSIVWLHDWPNVVYLDEYDFANLDFTKFKLFTLSESQTNEWMKVVGIPRDSFYITRNGFDPEKYQPIGFQRKNNKLIWASRPIRGLEILLDMLPRIRQRIPDAELHIFSYIISDKDSEIESYKDKFNQPGVVFRGAVRQDQLAREMAESRLMTYPGTFKETSCIIAIQAQAVGLPLITTNLAALPETVLHNEGGIIIDGDPKSQEYQDKFVEETIRLMLDDQAWRKLGEGGIERMHREYTWAQVAREWVEYISTLPGSTIKRLESKPLEATKLSLCMIVKNEEKNLPICLDSVKDIVDEIVIVDTGSEDRTIEIAEEYGAVVKIFKWIEDFAAARNESIKHASGDWILYLDADEKIEPEQAQKIRKVIENREISAVNMIEHIPQEEGNLFKTAASDYCRLFRRHPDVKFEGRVHEQVLPSINVSGGKVLKSDIRIEHWAFGESDEKKEERKKRNLHLLKRELMDAPDDPFIHFNLGQTYASLGNNGHAIYHFNKALELRDDTIKAAIVSTAYSTIAQLEFSEDHIKEASESARKAIEADSSNLLAYYINAGVAFQKEDFAEAEKNLLRMIEISESEDRSAEINTGQIMTDLGNCAFKTGNVDHAVTRYRSALDEDDSLFEAAFNLATCYLNQQDFQNARDYFKKAKSLTDDSSLIDQLLEELDKTENLLKPQ